MKTIEVKYTTNLAEFQKEADEIFKIITELESRLAKLGLKVTVQSDPSHSEE